MVEITLLELNLNAEDLIANAPFSSGGSGGGEDDDADDSGGVLPTFDDESDEDDEDELATADEDRNLKPLAVGAGLVVLVLLVVAGRRLLGGEPEPLP